MLADVSINRRDRNRYFMLNILFSDKIAITGPKDVLLRSHSALLFESFLRSCFFLSGFLLSEMHSTLLRCLLSPPAFCFLRRAEPSGGTFFLMHVCPKHPCALEPLHYKWVLAVHGLLLTWHF